jgi:hypothetical protein
LRIDGTKNSSLGATARVRWLAVAGAPFARPSAAAAL